MKYLEDIKTYFKKLIDHMDGRGIITTDDDLIEDELIECGDFKEIRNLCMDSMTIHQLIDQNGVHTGLYAAPKEISNNVQEIWTQGRNMFFNGTLETIKDMEDAEQGFEEYLERYNIQRVFAEELYDPM